MTDIIQQAKMLLNAIKHEYKALESRGAKPGKYDYDGFELWLDSTLLYGDGSEQTRHAIEAVAEETYEYAVQVKLGAKWLFLGRGVGAHSFAKNAFWFEKKEKAQGYQLIRQEMAPARIVRRRVSPVEAINE